MFNVEKLEVWQKAIDFADLIYNETRRFPVPLVRQKLILRALPKSLPAQCLKQYRKRLSHGGKAF